MRSLLTKRENRVKLLTRARMRCGGGWSDVCIVNLSRRGAGLQAANPPKVGTFVELRRGAHGLIIGQVRWVKDHRFGLRAQDLVWIEAFLNDGAPAEPPPGEWRDRRALPRPPGEFGWSQIKGRLLQSGFVAAAGISFAVAAGGLIETALAEPMQVLSGALGGERVAAR